MTTGNQMRPGGDIEDLLPWYAAGKLSRRDAERVAAAIASDPELARRFALVCEERDETILLNETLGAPSARAGDKLFAAVAAEGDPVRRRPSFDPAGRVSELLSALSPRALAWTAMAAALALVLQTGAIVDILVKARARSVGFELASAEQQSHAARQGSEIIVRFAPQATAADITKFLKAHNASVVEGPAGDLFHLRVAGARLSKEELERIVKTMQAEQKIVVTVLPVGN
jgi:anti-sigma factor RsiW